MVARPQNVNSASQPMTAPRVRLHSIKVGNYLGAGEPPLALELDGDAGVLCGPNNSGKSTLFRALELLKAITTDLVSRDHRGFQTPWIPEQRASPDIFHWEKDSCQLGATFSVPRDLLGVRELATTLKMDQACDPLRIRFEVAFRPGEKRLSGIWFEGHKVFDPNSETPAFALQTTGRQVARHPTLLNILDLPKSLSARVWYFPSLRVLGPGIPNDLASLAAGAGIPNWVTTARNPDARNLSQRQASETLREFEREFAKFADFDKIELGVPVGGGEINVSINGHLRPLSNLGSGIGEALLILLSAKIAYSGDNAFDVILLEEPELHLHPALQRTLVEQLISYGVQVVATTHSPTVVNWFARNGKRVFRTELDTKEERISVEEVRGLTELRSLIESIGATPADVVLAEKVLLVEGPNDIPVFKAWLRRAPSYGDQNITVLSLGGSDAASANFDPKQWRSLHPKIRAILDSERKSADEEPAEERRMIKAKLEDVGIHCHLTARRSTENYFTEGALRSVYGECTGGLDQFGDPNLKTRGISQFTKSRNGEVAQAMEWAEIATTDLGKEIEDFLKS